MKKIKIIVFIVAILQCHQMAVPLDLVLYFRQTGSRLCYDFQNTAVH